MILLLPDCIFTARQRIQTLLMQALANFLGAGKNDLDGI